MVLEGHEALPEGAVAEVLVRDVGDEGECDVTDEQWALLLKAHAQVQRGESVAVEVLAAKLRAQS